MANLTTRTELATYPATEDLIHIVDVSDTTDNASGTSKQITISNLLSGNAGASVVARIPVDTQTDPASGEFDFDLTDYQTGDKVVISGDIRSTVSAADDFAYVYLNADTTAANYHSQPALGANGASFFVETANPRVYIQANGGSKTDPGTFRLEMTDYAGSNAKQMLVFHGMERNTDDCIAGFTYLSSAVTAAVTRIRIRTDNHSTDTLTGTLKCWIERDVLMPIVSPGEAGTLVDALVPIQTITNTTAGEFDFSSLDPEPYEDFVLIGDIRSDVASVSGSDVFCYLNGDTTDANYRSQLVTAGAGGIGATQAASARVTDDGCPAATAISGAHGHMEIIVPKPAGSNLKGVRSDFSTARTTSLATPTMGAVWHNSTTAQVTRIQIRSESHGTYGLTGVVTLYGRKQITIAPGKHIIAEIDNMTTAGQFDFGAVQIPSNAKALYIEGYIRTEHTTTEDVNIYLNGDTTETNYDERVWFTGGGTMSANSARIAQVDGNPAAANDRFSAVSIKMMHPGRTDIQKWMESKVTAGEGSIAIYHFSTRWKNTAAINDIQIQNDNHATADMFGYLTLSVET